jgi:GPH family glycoside/pentoside/hexuronide:cation symporter
MKKFSAFSISFLAVPLAFVGIPIYLNVADFYAQNFSLNLALIGILLVFIRGFDAIQDPLVGYFSDRLSAKNFSHQKIIRVFSVILCAGFYLVFNPPKNLSPTLAATWFSVSLTLTYLAFNFVLINFESMIATSAKDDSTRVSINSMKEFLGLIGMILAFILPGIFTQIFAQNASRSYFWLSICFLILVAIANFLFSSQRKITAEPKNGHSKQIEYLAIFRDQKFVSFLMVFLVNSIAVSLPAANMNFYVRDVLAAEKNIPWFLSLYFVAAALFIPLWRFLFTKFGLTKSWILSIFGSVLTFIGAFFLNSESANYFFLVCIFSGAFLGADLIAPPVILAQISSDKKALVSSYFSLWNFVTKIGLMIAASGSLIILGLFGYSSGNSGGNSPYLVSFFYAALPCLLKTLVIALILRFKKYEI